MKRFLTILLSAIFVFSLAASALAIHAEIPSETQAVVAKGGTQITLGGELRTRGWYEKNISDLAMPTSTKSLAWYDQRLRLTVDAKVAPNVQGFVMLETNAGDKDTYTWGNGLNTKPTDLHINQAWILYTGSGLFGVNAGTKVGHMPLALGEKQFFDHTKFGDDALVFFVDPTKEMHIGVLTVKFVEGSKGIAQDDLDGYVGLLTYKLDPKNTIGINYTYLNKSDARFSHQNLGLHANGNLSGFNYNAEVDFQFSDASENMSYSGWAVLLKAGYAMDAATIRGMIGYGSGDGDASDDDVKNFTTYLGADQHFGLIYDYTVAGTSGKKYQGLDNTTILNLGVDYAATKDVKLAGDLYLLRASKGGGFENSKQAGWEADANVDYQIAKNLKYQFTAAYMKAGKFYGPEEKGVSAIRHTLTLNF